jgi:hypothetical protein
LEVLDGLENSSGFPVATLATAVLAAIGLILQLHFPSLLGWMQRAAGAIGRGVLWRVGMYSSMRRDG